MSRVERVLLIETSCIQSAIWPAVLVIRQMDARW